MSLQGFDKNYYLDAKLSALQATNPEWVGKTTSDLDAALQSAGLTAEQHYSTYGWKEGLEPNKFFNPEEYVAAKAAQMVSQGLYATASAATAAFNAGWTDNPYNHYLLYGGNEKLNPSNAFDESTYLTDLLTAAKASGATPQTTTLDDVRAYFAANGLTALGHYIDYGKAEGLHVTVVPAGEQVHAYDQQGFVLTAGAASYNEGSTAMFKLATTNVSDGTVLTYNLSGTGISTSDVTSGSLTGTVTVVNNAADISIGLRSDYTTEGSETLKVAIAGTNASAQSTVYDTSTGGNGGDTPPVVPPVNPPNTPTYTLTAGAASYSEGSTAVFNLVTTNVANGTVLNYTLAGAGITAADVTGGSLSGTVTVNNNAAVINVALANDVTTEGSETLVATVSGASASTVITDTSTAPQYNVIDITTDADKLVDGTAAIDMFTFAPTASVNGNFILNGFGAGDLLSLTLGSDSTATNLAALNGLVLPNGTVSVEINQITGDTLATFGLDSNGEVISLLLKGVTNPADIPVAVNSTTPPPVTSTYTLTSGAASYDEGATAVFNLATTNVANGTVLTYNLSGTNIADADFTAGTRTGTVTVMNNSAAINIGLSADATTEGAETLQVSISNTTATASTVINDTSMTPSGNPILVDMNSDADHIVTGSSDAEIFAFVPATGNFKLYSFGTNDSLRIDLPVGSSATNLAALNGLVIPSGTVAVEVNQITGSTLATFGLDSNGEVISLELIGVSTPGDVVISVV